MQHVARLSKALSIRLRSQLRWGVPWQGSGVTVCPTHTQSTMVPQGVFPLLSLYTLNVGHPHSKWRTRRASTTEKPAAGPAQQPWGRARRPGVDRRRHRQWEHSRLYAGLDSHLTLGKPASSLSWTLSCLHPPLASEGHASRQDGRCGRQLQQLHEVICTARETPSTKGEKLLTPGCDKRGRPQKGSSPGTNDSFLKGLFCLMSSVRTTGSQHLPALGKYFQPDFPRVGTHLSRPQKTSGQTT